MTETTAKAPESRAQMLARVIVAVDCARLEAAEKGDEHFVRYVEGELFPFLDAERDAARALEEKGDAVVDYR